MACTNARLPILFVPSAIQQDLTFTVHKTRRFIPFQWNKKLLFRKCDENLMVCFLQWKGGLFVREMGSVTHADGDNVHIPCHYGGYPVDKVIWQKDSHNLISNSDDTTWKQASKDSKRFFMFPNGTLKIAPISSELDKGMYTCIVSNRKGELASGSVNINVMRKWLQKYFGYQVPTYMSSLVTGLQLLPFHQSPRRYPI